jgi:hypothetical protein
VLRNLNTGEERRFDDVASHVFDDGGRRLAYAVSTRDGSGDGVYLLDLAAGTLTTVHTGEGEYARLVFDEAGEQLAFLSNAEQWGAEQPSHALYHWQPRLRSARRLVAEGSAGVPDGWWVSDNGVVRFSNNGQRIFFGTAPRPITTEDDGLLPEERVRVDIWHWNEPQIQPVQLRRMQQELRRTFEAVVHLRDGRVVQLADPDMPTVNVGARGDADVAIGSASEPYAVEASWEPGWSDQYLVDVRTGERTLFRERTQGFVQLSPTARYAFWYDTDTQSWHAMDVRNRRVVDMTATLPT